MRIQNQSAIHDLAMKAIENREVHQLSLINKKIEFDTKLNEDIHVILKDRRTQVGGIAALEEKELYELNLNLVQQEILNKMEDNLILKEHMKKHKQEY